MSLNVEAEVGPFRMRCHSLRFHCCRLDFELSTDFPRGLREIRIELSIKLDPFPGLFLSIPPSGILNIWHYFHRPLVKFLFTTYFQSVCTKKYFKLHKMYHFLALFALTASVSAYPPLLHGRSKLNSFSLSPRQDGSFSGTGVASFNNFASQRVTVCQPNGPGAATVGSSSDPVFPAAFNDLSILWNNTVGTNNLCGGPSASNSTSQCANPPPAPSCPEKFTQTFCNTPTCFQITNNGIFGGSGTQPNTANTGVGGKVTVQVIDVCPKNHPQNFCSTAPPEERCEGSNTQFDVDVNAFGTLTQGQVSVRIELLP